MISDYFFTLKIVLPGEGGQGMQTKALWEGVCACYCTQFITTEKWLIGPVFFFLSFSDHLSSYLSRESLF